MTSAARHRATSLCSLIVSLLGVCAAIFPGFAQENHETLKQLAVARNWTNYSGLTAVSWGPNRVDVFAVGENQSLQHKFYDGVWHDWQSLGGTLTSAPSVLSLYNEHLIVFAKGQDDAIWHKFYLKGRWSEWISLGGEFATGPRAVSEGTHFIEVIAKGKDNVLRRIRWAGTWQDWEAIKAEPEKRQYASRQWQTKDGLPHNFVYAVCQTRDGYLWLGTHGGLARFDGVRFTLLELPEASETKDNAVRFLHQTRDGTLWIGRNRGLVCWKDGTFSESPVTTDSQVKAMLETKDGTLWIATLGGLLRYVGGQTTHYSDANGLPGNAVLALCQNEEGVLWIGTNRGLISWHDETFRPPRDAGLAGVTVQTLFNDEANTLWTGLRGGGVLRSEHGGTRTFRRQQGIADGFINAIYEDSHGVLWAGTMGGLCRRSGERFVTEFSGEGTSYETVFCIAADKEDGLWVGTKEGLIQLRLKPFQSHSKQDGLSHNNVMSVLEDKRGSIWLATWGGGVNEFKDGQFVVQNGADKPFYDLLLSIEEASDGSLWLGGDHDGGLFQVNNGVVTRFGREAGLQDPAIRVIYEDRQTNLWIGTSGALYLRHAGQFHRFTKDNGLAGAIVYVIREDHAGNLWIGTDGGLNCIAQKQLLSPETADLEFTSFTMREGLPHNRIVAIHEDREGQLWIGTDGGGLGRVVVDAAQNSNGQKLSFSTYTAKQGLFSDHILEILEDDEGRLWMSSLSGVFRVKKIDLDQFDQGQTFRIPCVSYGKEDGMSSAQCNGVSKPAGWKSKDGRLWFPTTRGAVVVDPNSIQENDESLPMEIEEVIYDNRRVLIPGSQTALTSSVQQSKLQARSVVLTPGRGGLEFRYTALSFRAPDKNKFKYKLDGVDVDWVNADGRRTAHYNNVKPGSYTFRVIGCNSEGIWNETGTSVSIVLQPHFWQTGWFTGLMVLGTFGAVGGSVRFMIWRRVKAKLLVLEEQHAIERERSRIARDMHDELGSRMTEILLLSDQGQRQRNREVDSQEKYSSISNVTQEMAANLDALVWAVNPRHDSIDQLSLYLCDYVAKFLEPTSIRCHFDVPRDLPAIPFSSEARHNVLMVVKEGLNNIAKHSQATEVSFAIKLEGSHLVVTVRDNGRGFSPLDVSRAGNGLENMNKRMKTIGGDFTIQSALRSGTQLCLRVAIANA